jgi:hypothetical protein
MNPVGRERLEAVSAHFSGAPKTGAGPDGATVPPALMQAAAPTPPPPSAQGAKKAVPAKKREGC